MYYRVTYTIKSNVGVRWSDDVTVTKSRMFLSGILDTIVSGNNFGGDIRVEPCNKNGRPLQ